MDPELFKDPLWIEAIFCSPVKKEDLQKITLRPLLLKNKTQIQCTVYRGAKVFHENVKVTELKNKLELYFEQFNEAHLFFEDRDLHFLKQKNGSWKTLKRNPTKKLPIKLHNREKNYLISSHAHAGFWHALGIANREGVVYPQKFAKFRQVNRFIEIVETVIPYLPENLHIYDFGCGKGYLTFALYHYLEQIKGFKLKMVGIDLKQEVILALEKLRQTLHYEDLQFIAGRIEEVHISLPVDLVLSLHACDTATDFVLQQAVSASAKAILAVPCCQHANLKYIDHQDLRPLFQFGILKERFSALATDAARALWLQSKGYKTDILEFIDTEHTPKNLLIRATKKNTLLRNEEDEYKNFMHSLHLPII